MSFNGHQPLVLYACYMPVFPVRNTTNETENDRIMYLLNRGIEHILAISPIWRPNDIPDILKQRIVIPRYSSLFVKSKLFGRLYFNIFLLRVSYSMHRKGLKPILFFYGQDLIFTGSLIKIIFGFPYICYLGDSWLGIEPALIGVVNFKVKFLRAMEWFTGKADKIVLFNSVEKNGLVKKGFNGERIEVIPFSKNNDFDLNEVMDDDLSLTLQGKFLVSYHGNMEFKHNYDGAINIIKRIAPKVLDDASSDIVFLIVGNMFDNEEKPSNVITMNYIPEKEKLMQILSLSSLYIVPIDTGAGVKGKLLDALSLGIPAIVTPHIMSQMVSRDSPLIVSEVDNMAEKILAMFKISMNDYTSLKERTHLYFSNNYSQKVYEKYISIFQELL